MAEADVCALKDLPPGTVTVGEINGTRVCVVNVHGEVFAVQDRCPHLFAPLSAGELHGSNIVCPWHKSEFDCRSGQTKSWLPEGIWNMLDRMAPPLPPPLEKRLKPPSIRTFHTRVVDGRVLISDDEPA